MRVEFLVEESSAEAALINLVPKIVPGADFEIYVHGGKKNLLDRLPGRLEGYRHALPEDWRIVVLLDRDQESCEELKALLEAAARRAKLRTRTAAGSVGKYQVVNRLAVEELEAWFFGDVPALAAAYPGVPPSLAKQAKYRDPDAITGGTWEALERVLQAAGYYAAGLPKVEGAANVSERMDPARNRSKSFQVFRDALQDLVPPVPDAEEE
jgi:hypothetical protein